MEIKIRVWDKQIKAMFYMDKQGSFSLPGTIYGITKKQILINSGLNLTGQYQIRAKSVDSCIQMLSTTLKDKDEIEIYESDYIIGCGKGFSTTIKKEVFFTPNGAVVEIADDWIQLTKFKVIEVVGNKYETLYETIKENKEKIH